MAMYGQRSYSTPKSRAKAKVRARHTGRDKVIGVPGATFGYAPDEGSMGVGAGKYTGTYNKNELESELQKLYQKKTGFRVREGKGRPSGVSESFYRDNMPKIKKRLKANWNPETKTSLGDGDGKPRFSSTAEMQRYMQQQQQLQAQQPRQGFQPAPITPQPTQPPSQQQPPQETNYPAPVRENAMNFNDYTTRFQQQMDAANEANQARYDQGLGLWGQIGQQYAPGGSFGAGSLAQLEQQKIGDVAAAQQQMGSSGLWNTTVAAALPSAWEQQVGTPGRLGIEQARAGRYGEALAGQAGFIERAYDTGPDMGMFADLMRGGAAGPGGWGWGEPQPEPEPEPTIGRGIPRRGDMGGWTPPGMRKPPRHGLFPLPKPRPRPEPPAAHILPITPRQGTTGRPPSGQRSVGPAPRRQGKGRYGGF